VARWVQQLARSPALRPFSLKLERLRARWLPRRGSSLTSMRGWAVALRRLSPGDVVYSCGMGVDLNLELDLIAATAAEVHVFDPSPAARRSVEQRSLPPELYFYAIGLADSDGRQRLHARRADGQRPHRTFSVIPDGSSGRVESVECLTLETLTRRLGHTTLALLKLDIAGAEYMVLRRLLASTLRPAQLLVEFHHHLPGMSEEQTEGLVDSLRTVGYRLTCVDATGRMYSFLHEG
jgi:FkbM family methyltransferase